MPFESNPTKQDSFLRLSPGQRILSVAAEMRRAGHWVERGDPVEAEKSYARVLDLMDRCSETLIDKPNMLREYRRWREWAAGLYAKEERSRTERESLERALLWMHPESWKAFAA